MKNSISTLNILIIDDDPIARMLAKRNLEISGFKGSITSAENGLEGFDVLSKSHKDIIVVLDFHMPELDGVGLLRKLKSSNINPPVFMLSSSVLNKNKESCLVHDCVQDYFVKPMDQSKSKVIVEFANQFANVN